MSEYRFVKSLNKRTQRSSSKDVRTTNYGDNWEQASATCLALANHVCQVCHINRANRAHHIIPLSRGGTNSQINLKAVCASCHTKFHKHLR